MRVCPIVTRIDQTKNLRKPMLTWVPDGLCASASFLTAFRVTFGSVGLCRNDARHSGPRRVNRRKPPWKEPLPALQGSRLFR